LWLLLNKNKKRVVRKRRAGSYQWLATCSSLSLFWCVCARRVYGDKLSVCGCRVLRTSITPVIISASSSLVSNPGSTLYETTCTWKTNVRHPLATQMEPQVFVTGTLEFIRLHTSVPVSVSAAAGPGGPRTGPCGQGSGGPISTATGVGKGPWRDGTRRELPESLLRSVRVSGKPQSIVTPPLIIHPGTLRNQNRHLNSISYRPLHDKTVSTSTPRLLSSSPPTRGQVQGSRTRVIDWPARRNLN
jgi:hypothetical protein